MPAAWRHPWARGPSGLPNWASHRNLLALGECGRRQRSSTLARRSQADSPTGGGRRQGHKGHASANAEARLGARRPVCGMIDGLSGWAPLNSGDRRLQGPDTPNSWWSLETQCDAVRPRCIVVCPRPTANRLVSAATTQRDVGCSPLPVVHLTSRLLFASPTVCVCTPPFPRQSPGGWGPHRGLLQVVAAINRSRHPTGLGGCLSHGGAGVSLPWWQGFGERQTLACVVPHSPGPRRSLTRRRTGDRGPGGDGCFAIRQHPRQTAAPERPHDPWPGLIRPSCDVVEWWVGRGCRDPVQINNWISETGPPDYEIPWFF